MSKTRKIRKARKARDRAIVAALECNKRRKEAESRADSLIEETEEVRSNFDMFKSYILSEFDPETVAAACVQGIHEKSGGFDHTRYQKSRNRPVMAFCAGTARLEASSEVYDFVEAIRHRLETEPHYMNGDLIVSFGNARYHIGRDDLNGRKMPVELLAKHVSESLVKIITTNKFRNHW